MRGKERQMLESAFCEQLAEAGLYTGGKFLENHDWFDPLIRHKVILFLQECRSDFKLLSKEEFLAESAK
jgi:hypothetical protein